MSRTGHSAGSGSDCSFDHFLDTSANATVQMRYRFERDRATTGKGFVADALIDCARQLILTIRPAWRDAMLDASE